MKRLILAVILTAIVSSGVTVLFISGTNSESAPQVSTSPETAEKDSASVYQDYLDSLRNLKLDIASEVPVDCNGHQTVNDVNSAIDNLIGAIRMHEDNANSCSQPTKKLP